VVAVAAEPYVAASSATSLIDGDHNLWHGAGAAPAYLASNLEADPLFFNPAGGDYRLGAGSPAIDAGVDAGIGDDHLGVARPLGVTFDLGAFEHTVELFADGFEGGDLTRWSAAQP
jgi:hypothetical protein